MVVDAGSAAYLKPVVLGWLETPPPFDWSIRFGEMAAPTFAAIAGLEAHRGADVAREDSAEDTNADALLVSANGWPVEHAYVRMGRRKGIPAIQFVDSCYNYRRRFCADGNWILPDAILLVTERSIEEAVAEGVPKNICRAVGHPSWDAAPSLPPSEVGGILFVGAPVERDYGAVLGYTETDAWRMLKNVVAEGFERELCYAPHPEQAMETVPRDSEIVHYDPGALDRFDTLVGMFSAPLVDAYLAGRRSVSLQPGATETDMFFLSRQGYLPRVTDRDGLTAALAAAPIDSSVFASELRDSAARLNRVVCEALAA